MEIGALQAADQAAASLPFTGPSSGTLPLRPSPLPTWRKRKLSKGDAVHPPLPRSSVWELAAAADISSGADQPWLSAGRRRPDRPPTAQPRPHGRTPRLARAWARGRHLQSGRSVATRPHTQAPLEGAMFLPGVGAPSPRAQTCKVLLTCGRCRNSAVSRLLGFGLSDHPTRYAVSPTPSQPRLVLTATSTGSHRDTPAPAPAPAPAPGLPVPSSPGRGVGCQCTAHGTVSRLPRLTYAPP